MFDSWDEAWIGAGLVADRHRRSLVVVGDGMTAGRGPVPAGTRFAAPALKATRIGLPCCGPMSPRAGSSTTGTPPALDGQIDAARVVDQRRRIAAGPGPRSPLRPVTRASAGASSKPNAPDRNPAIHWPTS